jgi:hypothetical protein
MRGRGWLWAATCADILLLVFGLYMAISAADIAVFASGDFFAVAITVLFAALPVFCVVAPLAAWRAQKRKRKRGQVIGLFAAPWVYALFLIIFLFTS